MEHISQIDRFKELQKIYHEREKEEYKIAPENYLDITPEEAGYEEV